MRSSRDGEVLDGGPHRPELQRAFDAMHAQVDAHADAATFGLTDGQLVALLESREALVRRLDAVRVGVVWDLDGRGVGRRDGAAGTALMPRGRLKIRPR
ncbi:MAG: hypothetical protein ACQSGP_00835 [Frankia sp.]